MQSAHTDWQPNASIENLKCRAAIVRQIREWFYNQNILEVETPQIISGATTDPHIESFQVQSKTPRCLRTSAEFHQKRLLAAGSGDIYEIGKVFRVDESGRYHNPEFTMLEWYRCGIDHLTLIDEIEDLLKQLHGKNFPGLARVGYRELWKNLADIDIAERNSEKLACFIQASGCEVPIAIQHDYDSLLDLGMSTIIAESLGKDIYTCITDYPASQASLAKIDVTDSRYSFACRFEIYYGSVELANGYHELTDAAEQEARFEDDNRQRIANQKPTMPIDTRLIAALDNGMPDCAGVAIGLDRLMMVLIPEVKKLNESLSFDWHRA